MHVHACSFAFVCLHTCVLSYICPCISIKETQTAESVRLLMQTPEKGSLTLSDLALVRSVSFKIRDFPGFSRGNRGSLRRRGHVTAAHLVAFLRRGLILPLSGCGSSKPGLSHREWKTILKVGSRGKRIWEKLVGLGERLHKMLIFKILIRSCHLNI